MPDWDYLALDTSGRERRGTVAAPSVEDARARLDQRRFYVVRIEPGTGQAQQAPSLLSGRAFARKKLSPKQLTLFTRQLATLVQVTPLEESLRTISRQSEQVHVRTILQTVHAAVVEGRRLSEAMAREPKSFPPLYRAMVSAGESSGTLDTILERLADLLERQAQVRGKVLSAMAYPVVLAIVAVFVVIALMVFVVPKVVEQFDTVGQALPLLTRIVIGISDFLVNWWWLLLALIALLGVVAWRALSDPAIRLRFDRSLLRIPLIGRLIRDLHAARMSRTLATMVASRLPLLEGLALTTPTIHNRALRTASEDIVEAIRGGGSLSVALKRANVFPPLLVYLAASGEAAGKLDLTLERAADYLEREFDGFTTAALSLLEPLIIVVMGGIVALIVLSILLPILQLQSLAGI
ncbi:type II secretion system inner membrane protein GspF [Sphingomonas cavernae]|uniref:General secretion pathway protein F n=1 Tax=Sphingomonas cavernae TaxID=2320861 RepID=A0A418WNY8_9SPHN|nr:type II secretion system inner membrane protein GspF [Sphingomonas cavernae]RJF92939.1 type II secretion system protein GspF [Sphingomonas cavernae]